MTTKSIPLLIALTLALALAAAAQTPSTPKHHAIFQLSEPEGPEWSTVVVRVNNMRTAFEKDGGVQIEAVFFGAGINMLRKTNSAFEQRLKQLADNGVIISACQNAMRLFNVKTEDLFPFAAQVDAGVAELTRKQEAGWAYIH